MNNSIEQIMDVINDKVGDYISDGMYQDLKSDITFALAEKNKEIERLRNRDGKATITLCYAIGIYPFHREECKIIDFGVSDNHYSVESEIVNKAMNERKQWRDMCYELAAALEQLLTREFAKQYVRTGRALVSDMGEYQKTLSTYRALTNSPSVSVPTQKVGRWVKCSERLPECFRVVPIKCRDITQTMGFYTKTENAWFFYEAHPSKHELCHFDVIAWYDLPEYKEAK